MVGSVDILLEGVEIYEVYFELEEYFCFKKVRNEIFLNFAGLQLE